ncbi:Ig-like domain-containing protein [Weissella paramesenteroides]|uniref:Ig-like domain-containing protein n=1 Tax=Weissella paramesenteroides TaxID=1249 RepID=UPI0039821B0A
MAQTFDLYKDGKVEQTSVEAPIKITGLTPNTQYDNYALAFEGRPDKAPLSFKTAVKAVTGVSLDKSTLALETGATATVKATVAPADATDKAYTFSSADTSIATVDNNGKITAVKAGTVDITVKTHDGGKTAKVTVTITDPA